MLRRDLHVVICDSTLLVTSRYLRYFVVLLTILFTKLALEAQALDAQPFVIIAENSSIFVAHHVSNMRL